MVKQWEIYTANLNPSTGREQQGTRPVLVVSNNGVNNALEICTIIPFTSFKGTRRNYPTEIYVSKEISHLTKDSLLMIHQIRTISKERLSENPISVITNPSTIEEIKFGLVEYFDI